MAQKPKFTLLGKKVTPKNWQEFSISVNTDKGREESVPVIETNDWEFVRQDNDLILDYIDKGLTTGVGIVESPDFKIEIETGNGSTQQVFDGVLALNKDHRISCIRSTFSAQEHKTVDWMNDKFPSITFEYLAFLGEITPSDYKFIPYVQNSVPDYREAAIMLLSVFTLEQQILQAVEKITELVAESTNPFEATAIVRTVIYISYLTILLATIVKLVIDLVKILIQPVKYHAGMNALKLMQKGAAHFGLDFKSPILENDPFDKMVIIPEKYQIPKDPNDSRINGFLSPRPNEVTGYYKGSFADLINAMKEMFSAKVEIIDGTLWFVRDDYDFGSPKMQIQPILQREYKFNSDELIRNMLVSFQTDLSDKNTIQEYLGTSFQVTVQPLRYKDKSKFNVDGSKAWRIPFALAKRKVELTVPEQIVNVFLKGFAGLINGLIKAINLLINAINKVIKVINKILKALKAVGINISFQIKTVKNIEPVTLGNLIENRKNMMKLEYDNFTVPKVLLIDEGTEAKFNKLHILNESVLSAKFLYQNYHFINSPVPSSEKPTGTQVLIKQFNNHPFCLEDYNKIRGNSFVYSPDGKESRLVLAEWNIYKQHANLTIRIPHLYTNNLIETYAEPNGQ